MQACDLVIRKFIADASSPFGTSASGSSAIYYVYFIRHQSIPLHKKLVYFAGPDGISCKHAGYLDERADEETYVRETVGNWHRGFEIEVREDQLR